MANPFSKRGLALLVLRHRNQIPKKPRAGALFSGTALIPAPSRWRQSTKARESPAGFHVCHVPKDQGKLESHKPLGLCNHRAAKDKLWQAEGWGAYPAPPPASGPRDWLVLASFRSGGWVEAGVGGAEAEGAAERGAERSWLPESQAGRTLGWRRGCTLVLVVRGAASAVDTEAL